MGNIEITDISNLANNMMGGAKEKGPQKKEVKNTKNNFYKKQNGNENKNFGGYIGAPYNFVPFKDEKVYYKTEEPAAHNSIADDLMSGEITYEIESKTPVFVDDGTERHHFHKNAWGKYSIPGSSIRGLIRNNVQVLGFSSFADDIDDYALMYRNVANGAEKKNYNSVLGSRQLQIGKGKSISVLENVKAGYIEKNGSDYYIYQTCVDTIKKEYGAMNYYVLNERKIAEEYVKYRGNSKFGYDFLVQNGRELTQNLLEEPFEKWFDKNEKVHYKGKKNPSYQPGFDPVSYELKDLKNVTNLGKEGQYSHKGYLIRTGFMNEKKALYVIPEIAREKDKIKISAKDIEAFKIDFKKKEKTIPEENRVFFNLPKEDNRIKPVFYIELGGKLYFGFTPRLRLFYSHTIKDGLSAEQKKAKIDYAKAIFGYSNENGSYRSRVSFSDAVTEEKNLKEEKEYRTILAEPKPTSYLDYLDQEKSKEPVTYNTEGFKLRGVKQYWLHEKEEPGVYEKDKEKVMSVLHPLKKGTVFKGKIRFRNLKEDELGLLLWAVRLEANSRMNLGKAKAFGFGNVKMKLLEVKKLDVRKAYLSGDVLELNPFQPLNADKLIENYKQQMAEQLKLKKLEDSRWISSFFAMKDSGRIPDPKDIRYMSIDKREYQNRKGALPTIEEVIKKTKG